MLQALAMLGAGAQGYMNADDLMRKRKIEDDQLARQKVMQGREDQQYMQAQTDDQAARNAMAPVTVDSAPVAVPIGSRDEPQAPEDRGIRVAGQQFPDQASAQAAADGQNTITARMQRAAGVVQNPLLAAKLGGDAQAAELSGLNLASAKRTAGNQKFDDDAHEAIWKGPQATAEFLSSTHADGKGGQVKFQAVTDPATKKWQIVRVADDGALVPFGPQYSDDDSGKVQALYQLSKSVSPADKEKHVLEQSRLTRQEKRDADLNASTIEHNKVLDRYYNGRNENAADANDIKAGKAGGAGKMSADDAAELKNIDEEHRDGRKRLDAAGIAALGLDPTGKSFAPGNPVYDRIAEQQSMLVKRRRDLVAKYRESAAGPANADPRGVRDKPATPNMADAVAAAIKKNGDGPDTKIALKDPGEPYLKTSMQAAAENEALSRPKAANSTPAPAAAKAASTAAAGPFKPDSNLEAQTQTEMEQMSDPKINRMAFSPEVKAYMARKKAAEDGAADKANSARSTADLAKQKAQRVARGY